MDALFGTEHNITLAQECARAVLVFAYGLIMLRLSGRRTFARWSALDIITSIIVGSALSRVITASVPMGATLAAIAVLVALHLALAHAVARSSWLSRLVEGGSVTLAKNGELDESRRRRHMISKSDLAEALRRCGLNGLDDIAKTDRIELEPSGRINVVKR
jgi:uncharacterized membrane protein YcaP (DUF421 family)